MQDRARQQEDAKNSILTQIMDQNARARCKSTTSWILNIKVNFRLLMMFVVFPTFLFETVNTLKISKPEKAQMVEGMIVRMAQMGQLQGKLDDAQLVQLLESVNSQMPRSTSSVKFDRRRAAIDSDDEDDYGL